MTANPCARSVWRTVLQYLAQGACQAPEDAVCLGESLARYPNDPAQAFAAYQEPRVRRTARVQRAARVFGELMYLDRVARAVRDELLRRRAADDFTYVEFLHGRNEATSGADRRLERGGVASPPRSPTPAT
jgi:2-polyprenyl-6-methoxyphenol hydroxylase-like FAD-dependent oxidoreductase